MNNTDLENNISNSLYHDIKQATNNSDFSEIKWHDSNEINRERLSKIYFVNTSRNPWHHGPLPESKLLTNNCLKSLKYLQIFSCIVSLVNLITFSILYTFDTFIFGCFTGCLFLLFYNYLFNGDPLELVMIQTRMFLIINIGMVILSGLLVISSIVWSSINEDNNLLTILKIVNTFLLYFNISISVCRLNDKILTPTEYNIFEMFWYLKQKGKWNIINDCIESSYKRNSYLKSYEIQQMFYWVSEKIRFNLQDNLLLITLGFLSLTLATIISSVKLFLVNVKHECLIVIALGILTSVLLYPFFYLNNLLSKLGRSIYYNEYEIWKDISHNISFSLDLTTSGLIKMLLPVIITTGASLINSILN